MASIDPFLESTHSFDPEAIKALGEAFEAACRCIEVAGQTAITREEIARRIIEHAKRGERDPAPSVRFRARRARGTPAGLGGLVAVLPCKAHGGAPGNRLKSPPAEQFHLKASQFFEVAR